MVNIVDIKPANRQHVSMFTLGNLSKTLHGCLVTKLLIVLSLFPNKMYFIFYQLE